MCSSDLYPYKEDHHESLNRCVCIRLHMHKVTQSQRNGRRWNANWTACSPWCATCNCRPTSILPRASTCWPAKCTGKWSGLPLTCLVWSTASGRWRPRTRRPGKQSLIPLPFPRRPGRKMSPGPKICTAPGAALAGPCMAASPGGGRPLAPDWRPGPSIVDEKFIEKIGAKVFYAAVGLEDDGIHLFFSRALGIVASGNNIHFVSTALIS